MTLRFLALTPILAPLAVAASASAATPASGQATLASPISWTGHVTEPTGTFEETSFLMQRMPSCNAPVCDAYQLTVPEGTGALLLDVKGTGASRVGYEVTDPMGRVTCVDGPDDQTEREADFENPAGGVWQIRTTGTGDFDYVASARLQKTAGGVVPPAATPTTLSVASAKQSATALKRVGRLRIKLTTNAALSNVTGTITRAGHTYAKTTSIDAHKQLVFKLARKLKKGRYTIKVAATDPSGTAVKATAALTIT